MQTYPITLSYGQTSQPVSVAADLFVYESAVIATRKNLLLNSGALDQAPWARLGAVATADKAIGSTGAKTLELLAGTNAVTSYNYQTVAGLDAPASYVLSLEVRAGTSGNTVLKILDAAVSVGYAAVNIIWTGGVPTIGGGMVGFSKAGVDDLGGGLYRVWATYANPSYTSLTPAIYPDNSNGTGSVYAGNVQLESGTLPTPYQESGAVQASGAGGDSRIKVKADSGSEIVLKPGQRVRMTEQAQRWYVTSMDGMTPMTVNAIIGNGEFDDANTLNKFTFDSTSAAISTRITNDTTQRVPVTLDPAQIAKETNDGQTYTTSWNVSTATSAGQVYTVVAPGANVNGIRLLRSVFTKDNTQGGFFAVLARSGAAPTNIYDGDCIVMVPPNSSGDTSYQTFHNSDPIIIPPGKGLYVVSNAATAGLKSLLYAVL
jgi:hypothetical protein